jgi:hypothetical protein
LQDTRENEMAIRRNRRIFFIVIPLGDLKIFDVKELRL